MPLVETISANATPAIRWFRELFTRQSLIAGLKTAAWVVPLTIAIWFYAAQQKPSDSVTQALQIQFHTNDPDRIVAPVNPADTTIMVKLNGPKAAVDDAVQAFSKPGDNPIVRIDVPTTLANGQPRPDEPTNLTISDRVRDAEIFKTYGVTVSDVSPASINVNIDTMKTIDVPVKIAPDSPVEKGSETFVPPTVKITAPVRIIQNARESVTANPRIPTEGDAGMPGSHVNILVPVAASISGENVAISPNTVKASYTIKQNDTTADIPSLSILRLFGGGLEDQYSVEGAQTNIRVTISGPKDQVDRVMNHLNTKQLRYEWGEANIRVLANPPNAVTYSVKKRQSGS
jgi:hypothetical protein